MRVQIKPSQGLHVGEVFGADELSKRLPDGVTVTVHYFSFAYAADEIAAEEINAVSSSPAFGKRQFQRFPLRNE
jgi:hypothetical protein